MFTYWQAKETVHFQTGHDAIQREKRLKKYNRQWKLKLIEEVNPDWKDLYDDLITGSPGQAGG
jgi:predicted GIY-YIG superfamily endonuclease